MGRARYSPPVLVILQAGRTFCNKKGVEGFGALLIKKLAVSQKDYAVFGHCVIQCMSIENVSVHSENCNL